jgi:uracil-DNA glycosylase family 4
LTTVDAEERWTKLEEEIVACRRCTRLAAYREEVARTRRRAYHDQEYWGKPVPGFGDHRARLLIFGLAPGAHGSNRTGRMFTGDSSGEFLYAALHRAGFANQPTATSRNDGLRLEDVFISATCRCVPPDNKPLPDEILNCRPFILMELDLLTRLHGIVALGKIGFDAILAVYRQRGHTIPALEFKHEQFYEIGYGLPWVLASYHPSRQNTQTGRLTLEMFDNIWEQARRRLG